MAPEKERVPVGAGRGGGTLERSTPVLTVATRCCCCRCYGASPGREEVTYPLLLFGALFSFFSSRF